MKTAILTDTNADLPAEQLEGQPIFVLPLHLRVGDEEFADGESIHASTVYRRQKTERYQTALPQWDQVEAMLDRIRQAGYTHVVALMLADALSGTANLIRMVAKEYEGLEICVIDTKSASVGVGILVLQAVREAETATSFAALCSRVTLLTAQTHVFFSLDTLEYLWKGGRIGRAKEIAGMLLQIKPILSLNEAGEIFSAAKVRGRKAIQQKLLELIDHVKPGRNQRYNLVICDGGVPDEADELEQKLRAMLPHPEVVMRGCIDATLAVHLGPNLLGAGVQIL